MLKTFIEFIKNNFNIIYFYVYFFRRVSINIKSQKKLFKNRNHQTRINAKSKKSEIVFILGSGSSVNDLSDNDISHIEKHDTIGFNFWLYHDIVPDYYIFETPRDSIRKEEFYKLFSKKIKDPK